MPSLTSHLLSLDSKALEEATTHPFLSAAATQSLPLQKLKSWLAQDRLYQMAYIPFIGHMLTMIDIPNTYKREETLEWRTADLLIDSLTNIREEMRLFEQTAQDEGWLDEISDVEPSVQTRAYQDLFAGATAQGRPLVVGLTVLWATEYCYLTAWRWARSQMKNDLAEGKGDVMQKTFIPAWSSGDFEKFVKRIEGLVNEHGALYDEASNERKECDIVWKQVLWAEREFWPDI